MIARLIRNRRGAAAVELALVTPLLLLLMFGSAEVGNFFMDEHRLTKAVRDGSVYASRQAIGKFNCAGPSVDSTVVAQTRELVQTSYLRAIGATTTNPDTLANWANVAANVTIGLTCQTAAGGTTLSGIYTLNNGVVPVITVTATLPYQPVLQIAGFNLGGFSLNATQTAIVVAG